MANQQPLNTVGILLAAGKSSRFGSDKRRAQLADGSLMLEKSLALMHTALDTLIVAVQQREPWLEALLPPGAHLLEVPATKGLGDTLAAAVDYADTPLKADAVVIALADMPWIQPATVRAVVQNLNQTNVLVPLFKQQWGHPTGFGRDYFDDLKTCRGDRGARWLLEREKARGTLLELDVDDPAILWDMDTPLPR